MPPTRIILLYAALSLISLIAGIFTAQWLGNDGAKPSPIPPPTTVGIPEYRVDFTLQDLNGQPRRLSEWDGKVILLNFWATWCPPCRREMPDFVTLREELDQHNFEIIGIALDRAEPVQDFIDEIGVEYPILLAAQDGITIMLHYGNQLTTLPYSVIIDQNGKILKTFRKEISKQDILPIILPSLGIKKHGGTGGEEPESPAA